MSAAQSEAVEPDEVLVDLRLMPDMLKPHYTFARVFAAQFPDGLVMDGPEALESLNRLRASTVDDHADHRSCREKEDWQRSLHMSSVASAILVAPWLGAWDRAFSRFSELANVGRPRWRHPGEAREPCQSVHRGACVTGIELLFLYFKLQQRDGLAAAPIKHHEPPRLPVLSQATRDGVSIRVHGSFTQPKQWACGDPGLGDGHIYWQAEVTADELDIDGFVIAAATIIRIIEGANYPNTSSCEQVADTAARTLLKKCSSLSVAVVSVWPHGGEGRHATSRRSR